MWAVIAAFLNAATAYLNLEILKYPERLADECDTLEDRIHSLRRSPAPADQLLADRLQQRLLRKRGVVADALSAARVGDPRRAADPDPAGNLPPAGK
jgi:uncharacterized protein YdcH (DUF465 family)